MARGANALRIAPEAASNTHARAPRRMELDLKNAAEELVKVRRARIKALYASERAGWQAELAARGLAIATFGE